MKKVFRVEETTYLATARFMFLFEELHKLNGIEQEWSETLQSLVHNKVVHRYLSSISRFKGIQKIFRFEVNGKIIIVITTYDPKTGTAKRTGNGWVLIIDLRYKRPFFSFPLRRTRYFIERILAVTQLFIMIAKHWPICPECKEHLSLIRVPGVMLMRAYTCLSKKEHKKVRPYFWITKMLLPEKYLQMLQERYEQYYLYRHVELIEKENNREYAVVLRAQRIEEQNYGPVHNTPNPETIYYNDTKLWDRDDLYLDAPPGED